MGGPMAANLRKAGHALRVFDLSKGALERLTSVGCEAAHSPRHAAENADVVVTMLPANEHVLGAYLNPETGVLAGAKKGTMLIDSSTVNPDVSKRVHAAAAHKLCFFVDAPVSGGVGGATNATLTFMVGSDGEQVFARAKPFLEHMGKNIVLCGPVGSGQIAKICNNMLLAISMIGTAEAMNLGIKLGMDRAKLAGVLNTSSGRCWSSEVCALFAPRQPTDSPPSQVQPRSWRLAQRSIVSGLYWRIRHGAYEQGRGLGHGCRAQRARPGAARRCGQRRVRDFVGKRAGRQGFQRRLQVPRWQVISLWLLVHAHAAAV